MEVLTDRGFRFVAGRPVLLQATRMRGAIASHFVSSSGYCQSLTVLDFSAPVSFSCVLYCTGLCRRQLEYVLWNIKEI